MPLEIWPVPAALLGAIAFGAGDFAGGRAAVRLSCLPAVAAAQIAAAATGLAVLAASGATMPDGAARTLSMAAGAFHVVAVFFLYQGFARGRICVVAPVAAVAGISVPVLADMIFIEMARPAQIAGIVLAAAAVVLISRSAKENNRASAARVSIGYGLVSGLGYGMADLCLGVLDAGAAQGGVAAARLTGAGFATAILFASALRSSASPRVSWIDASMPWPLGRGQAQALDRPVFWPRGFLMPRLDAPAKRGLALCVLAGVLDCLGQLGYAVSATEGQMSVAAALVALYPAVSIGLAVWLLKEKIQPAQLAGLLTRP